MYRVVLMPKVQHELEHLPKETQERVIGALERSRIRPHAFFERLVGEKLYRLRVGKYRVIADIQDDKIIILVVAIGHRKDIYKR